jgi:hypothetical protein
MDSIVKNYEEVLDKPPSTRIFLKFLRHKFAAKRAYKKNIKKETKSTEHVHNDPPEGIEVVSFAILIDNVVVDVMHVQKEFGDILKKNPTFISIEKEEIKPQPGFVYKNGSFMSMYDILKETHVTLRG